MGVPTNADTLPSQLVFANCTFCGVKTSYLMMPSVYTYTSIRHSPKSIYPTCGCMEFRMNPASRIVSFLLHRNMIRVQHF